MSGEAQNHSRPPGYYPPRWVARPLRAVLSWLAGEPVDGWTPIAKTIFLVPDPADVLVTHERAHVFQILARAPQRGPKWWRFTVAHLRYWRDYVWGWVAAGFSYRNNKLERQARAVAGQE